MENLILFLATSLALHAPTPKFKRYIIGSAGCSSLLFSGANSLYIKYTKDGEKVYFNEHKTGGVTYGLIVVQMKEVFTLEEASTILAQYTKAVRIPFKIVHHLPMEMEKQNQTASWLVLGDQGQNSPGLFIRGKDPDHAGRFTEITLHR